MVSTRHREFRRNREDLIFYWNNIEDTANSEVWGYYNFFIGEGIWNGKLENFVRQTGPLLMSPTAPQRVKRSDIENYHQAKLQLQNTFSKIQTYTHTIFKASSSLLLSLNGIEVFFKREIILWSV